MSGTTGWSSWSRTAKPGLIVRQRVVRAIAGRADSEFTRQQFGLEVQQQSLHDVRFMMVMITDQEMQGQLRLKNPATRTFADDKEVPGAELPYAAQYKTRVEFGVSVIVQAAMREVEDAVQAAMQHLPEKIKRKLEGRHHWYWLYLPSGGGAPRRVTSATVPPLRAGEKVVYRPLDEWMTYFNNVFANRGGKGRKVRVKGKGTVGEGWQNTGGVGMGFLGFAARHVNQRRGTGDYRVRASRDLPGRRFDMPNERSIQGTGWISIQAIRKPKSPWGVAPGRAR